ncbi:MAG: tRNA (N6-isopentenyl adenosine(37)-C2)-methylthiotransferase MiaB [Deltaproteobacteria bacterium]|nr:tRNA (N6-isopentenyl adenosine(37)-C2)-methylthiotransferase MiaB [Deltaproteobacteria bacterium]
MRSFFIRTFGCQMNVHDSDRMAGLLEAAGLQAVDRAAEADLILINTCSVRAKPEHKALSEAGRHKQARRRRGAKVVLTGCVAQQHGARLLDTGLLDAVVGTDAVGRIGSIVERLARDERGVCDVRAHGPDSPCFAPLPARRGCGVSRLVTVMKGCDNHCAYCIVPLVRGCEVSKPLADVLAEVEALARAGAQEITLLGQNVNSYRDPESGTRFPGLLRALDRQAAVDRIRFTTSHPKDLGDDLIEAMAGLPRVCEHLHLALQSGSDEVLGRMRRGYSRQGFLDRARALRASVPGIALSTDLIVGFPGEREADFRATMDAVEEAAFDSAFSFKYSPRPGTPAARELEDDVPASVKQRRLETLQDLLARLEARSLARLEGRRLEVLVEGQSLRDPRAQTGRTRCNRVVNFASEGAAGETVCVRMAEARGHTLLGELLEVEPGCDSEK